MSVYRGLNQTISIKEEDLVVGDIYRIHTGMIIPADTILIQAGHSADEVIQNDMDKKKKLIFKNSNEKKVIVTEEEVTGEHDFKQKTAIL